MDEVLHANIFFFIASIATVLFTLLLCIVLYQVIKILRSIRKIVDRVEEGSEVLVEDIEHIRSFVLEGSLISQIVGFFLGKKRSAGKSRSRKK